MTDVFSIFIKLIMLYGISSAYYSLLNNFIPLSMILGFCIVVCMIYIFLKSMKPIDILVISLVIFMGVWSTAKSVNKNENISAYINIATIIMMAWKMGDCNIFVRLNRSINNFKSIIRLYVLAMTILLAIELFIPACYSAKENWGGGVYFLGFSFSWHVMASSVCLIATLWLATVEEEKIKLIDLMCMGTYLLAILQAGARVFLIPIAIIAVLYYRYHIYSSKIKYILIPLVVVIGIYIIMTSNMFGKFIFLSQTGSVNRDFNLLDTFTSGRTVMWSNCIIDYLQMDRLNQMFGNGFDYVKTVIYRTAHNDFVDALLGIGAVGAVFYTIVISKPARFIKGLDITRIKKLIWILTLYVYLYSVFFLDGMYGYMHFYFSYFIITSFSYDRLLKKERDYLC